MKRLGRAAFASLLAVALLGREAFDCQAEPTAAAPVAGAGRTADQMADGPAAPAGLPVPHFADATDLATVLAGREIYRAQCTRCHGRRLEGQALWQLQDRYAGRRAPPLGDAGHAWQHPDEELYRIVHDGRRPGDDPGRPSGMPAFAGQLDEGSIVQVLAFVKSRWSIGIRAAQASLNPEFAGMPPGADQIDWRLPANCNGLPQPPLP